MNRVSKEIHELRRNCRILQRKEWNRLKIERCKNKKSSKN